MLRNIKHGKSTLSDLLKSVSENYTFVGIMSRAPLIVKQKVTPNLM